MAKNKKDLLKKKLIAQQLAQSQSSFASQAPSGSHTAAMPQKAIVSKIAGVNVGGEYAVVFHDIRNILIIMSCFLILFVAIYFIDLRIGILTKLANFIFDKIF